MMLPIIFVMIRTSILGAFFLISNVNAINQEQSSLFKSVMEQNQRAIPLVVEESVDEDFYPYLVRCMKQQYELNDQKRRTAVFKILEKSELKKQFAGNSICNDQTTWQDLHLFCGQKDVSVYLASIIDRTHTAFGQAVLYSMLVNPTTSIVEIERKQKIIRYLIDNPNVLEKLDKGLQNLKESENMVLSFWCEDPLRQEIKKERYLQWPIQSLNDYVNKSETCLAIINSWSHIERILYLRDYILASFFVTGYHSLALANIQGPDLMQETSTWLEHERGITAGPILTECLPRIENNTGKNILGILAGLYAMMNISDWASWTRDQFYLDSCLHIKMMHLANYFQAIREFNQILLNSHQLNEQLSLAPFLNIAHDVRYVHNSDIQQLLTLLAHPSFKDKPSHAMHQGRSLLCFKLMNEQKDLFNNALAAIGEIDAYVSLAKLVKEHEEQKGSYCFVECIKSEKPAIDITNFWNPFVDQKKIVLNSLTMGVSDHARNIIITGPNAGGKSTVLKALVIDVLMAQSFGIAPAERMIFTPFSKITTYMNVRDDIAAGNSLFKAQVLRAQELLEFVQSLDKGSFCFVIIDEMFNGTSPLEAQACAYSVAKNFGSHANTLCLIATHFSMLTALEKDTHVFNNYSVQVQQSSDGTIIYPFKLKPGISTQYVALDILKFQGFTGNILNDAHRIINSQ